MLVELYIRNFAIIDELRLRLGGGLNVLTGETGAGKSIIVDALGAALGQRVGSEMVRTGADQALVEAVFDLGSQLRSRDGAVKGLPDRSEGDGDDRPSGDLAALLSEHGLEIEDGLLILSREINRVTGRTTARINSRLVPLSLLQQLGQMLVDIHGQSEHLSLLRVREHLGYLDRYAGLTGLREEVGAAVRELRVVRSDIDQMARDEREAAREIDLLSYQIQEIRAADLSEGEEQRLALERARLRNAERLRELSHSIYRLLSGNEERPGAVDLLAQAERLWSDLARLDPSLDAEREPLESARYAVEEIAQRSRAYALTVEDDPEQLNQVEERLELLGRLKRKYGGTVEEVLKYREEAEARLERLSNRAYYLDELRSKEKALMEEVGALASALSRHRRSAAVRLAEEVQRELAELNMAGTRFEVAFSVCRDPKGVPWVPPGDDSSAGPPEMVAFDSTGVDRVEFLVSPNPGEEPKPLARIASGGETARLMLALKTILCQVDPIPTLVFDEIDVGVGARSGSRVAEKLWNLTGSHQVLCITHLPQIACMADEHLSVAKAVDAGRTRTVVKALDRDQRVMELAAMLVGTPELASGVAGGEELLGKAEEWKRSRVQG